MWKHVVGRLLEVAHVVVNIQLGLHLQGVERIQSAERRRRGWFCYECTIGVLRTVRFGMASTSVSVLYEYGGL